MLILRCQAHLSPFISSRLLQVISPFCLLPLSFSHCLTRHLISCLLSTSHPGWWQSAQPRGPKKKKTHCFASMLCCESSWEGWGWGGWGGDIWLSHSNLCRVKHCRWAGEGGREKVGSVVITERDHYSVKEAALVLISFKSRFWIRISGGRLRGVEEKSSSQWSCQWWPCLLERWERQNERWGEEKGQRGVIERPLRANSTVDVGVRPVPWRP